MRKPITFKRDDIVRYWREGIGCGWHVARYISRYGGEIKLQDLHIGRTFYVQVEDVRPTNERKLA